MCDAKLILFFFSSQSSDMNIEMSIEARGIIDLHLSSELRKKKIFIATPMYGGNCTGMFSKACIDLATMCANYGVETRFFFIFKNL